MPAMIVCEAPRVLDGDSIACGNIGQVRLMGIDAPDRTSARPCREGFGNHVCDDHAAAAAKASLKAAIAGRRLLVEPVTRDRYRRIVGLVSANGVDLSCWQLRRGVARYIVRYDNYGKVRSTCRW